MANPYQPPRAALGDVAAPLSRPLRVLRALAVLGSALIGLAPLAWWLLFPETRQLESVVYAACYFVLSAISLAALIWPSAERTVSGTALVLNGLALAFLVYMLYARRDVAEALVLIVPTLLNLAAITALARARES
jgi:hypothetical protein